MKRFLGLLLLVFVGTVGWRIGSGLSSDAISMAVGVFFGIVAGIPAVLLVLATDRRRPERTTREYGRDYGQTVGPPNGREYGVSRHEGYYLPPQPPVIVLTGSTGTAAQYPYAGLPGHGQPAGYPADWATTRPARQYKVVGEQEEWVQEWEGN